MLANLDNEVITYPSEAIHDRPQWEDLPSLLGGESGCREILSSCYILYSQQSLTCRPTLVIINGIGSNISYRYKSEA
jgi:hypothetical protein